MLSLPHKFCSHKLSSTISFMEEKIEAPSFRHLPVDIEDINKLKKADNKEINHPLKKVPSARMSRRTSIKSSTTFEFSMEPVMEMSPAEDIISRGRIKPLRARSLSSFPRRGKQPLSMSPLSPHHQATKGNNNSNKANTLPRRSDSLPDFQIATAPPESPQRSAMKRNRSAVYRKFGRSKSMMMNSNSLNSTAKSLERCDTSSTNKAKRPKWYNFMFGVGRFPQEMKLHDMKTRWLRKSPSTMFAQVDKNGDLTGQQSTEKRSWTLLRQAFSCKGSEIDPSPTCATRVA